ncbi:MAG TPA: hypothetical protein DCP91_03125 [Eggerthellaceae bacterium]|nr:hypothetical protein [Eggerthellaceae bacterium]
MSAVSADAIVVAANEWLQITGGVGMTVARAAGLQQLQAACDAIGHCPCGSAVATPAFNLDARVVVHAVGPTWHGGHRGEADTLRETYDAALECAFAEGARSVALPLISAGTYGFPSDVSLAVAREAIRAFLNRHDSMNVRLVLYSRESVAAGIAAYLDIAEYIDDHYVADSAAWNVPQESIIFDAQAPGPAFSGPRFESEDAGGESPRLQAGAIDAIDAIDAMGAMGAMDAAAPEARQPKERRGLFARFGEALERSRPRRDESRDGEGVAEGAIADGSASAVLLAPQAAPDEIASEADSIDAAMLDAALEEASAEPSIVAPAPAASPSSPTSDGVQSAERAMGSAGALVAPGATGALEPVGTASMRGTPRLEDLLDNLDAPFSTTLLALIDERGMSDAQVYKRANMSRQLFSKIRSNASYRPTKKTALALAVALGLDLEETRALLGRAGFALSRSSKADVIVEYFIRTGNYDIFQINEALYAFDQPIL